MPQRGDPTSVYPTNRELSCHPLQEHRVTGPSGEKRNFQAGCFCKPSDQSSDALAALLLRLYFFKPAFHFVTTVSGSEVAPVAADSVDEKALAVRR
jgi:hypothetical protein